ncbi:MAG: hypothetical protein FGM24_04190 [Candidatus Kapabacteria bacterium]|nr:hypothetical protein [Candidatus Kapabacteria bacterium]
MTAKRSTSLRGALVTILLSCFLGAILMVAAALRLEEPLYYLAAVAFVVAGVFGYIVVSKLDAKINSTRL